MPFWKGYTEEDFLDEDEKRLRRESEARNKKAHSRCAADHCDDGGRFQREVVHTVGQHSKDKKQSASTTTAAAIFVIVALAILLLAFLQ